MSSMSEKASELKSGIQESLNRLAKMIDEQRASQEMRRHLDFMSRFHRYSWGNCWLISEQRPDVTMVAGFTQWKRMGRNVKSGERAIRILAPCPVRRENSITGNEEERVFFRSACVFDVLQTEGKELPGFDVPDVQSAADDLLRRLELVAAGRNIQLSYKDLGNDHYGVSKGGRVEIAVGYSSGQQAKSLAHELAHEDMHRIKNGEIDTEVNRDAREMEAEAVAYTVCRHFGLDVELRASRYIAMWGGDAKALGASLSRISKAARELIEDVEEQKLAVDVPLSQVVCVNTAA